MIEGYNLCYTHSHTRTHTRTRTHTETWRGYMNFPWYGQSLWAQKYLCICVISFEVQASNHRMVAQSLLWQRSVHWDTLFPRVLWAPAPTFHVHGILGTLCSTMNAPDLHSRDKWSRDIISHAEDGANWGLGHLSELAAPCDVCVFRHMWRSEDNVRCHPQVASTMAH